MKYNEMMLELIIVIIPRINYGIVINILTWTSETEEIVIRVRVFKILGEYLNGPGDRQSFDKYPLMVQVDDSRILKWPAARLCLRAS